jgi:thiamine-phosphate pyrophosphorylase
MLAAEAGADYVMFGEPRVDGTRPAFDQIVERIGWWAEVFESPCVGYAGAGDEIAPLVAAGADFIALGDFIWRGPVVAQIVDAMRQLNLPETAA